MRPEQLTQFLTTAVRHQRRVLIKGKPGIGKSDLVNQVSEATAHELKIFHPAISDPTDFSGLPCAVGEGDDKHAEFLAFGQLRALIKATKPTIAFFDDIGQAPPAVQSALMQLILARRVNGHTLSDTVVFVGATNDTTHMAGVSGMIEPLKSRWDTIVELEVNTDDWCNWALDRQIAAEVIAFIRFKPALLSDFKPTRELKNSPSPRGWLSVAQWLKAGVQDLEVFSGAVGDGAATEFLGFLRLYEDLPSLDAILLNPQTTVVPDSPSAQYAVTSGLAMKATPANLDRVMTYLERLPIEFNIRCIRDAHRINKTLAPTPAFVAWATRHSDVLL